MLFHPAQLGLAHLDKATLEADKKACKKIGPCGVGKKALYLNSFYIDRRYYLPYGSISRVFKRVAMSAGGFTGKGMFASMAYLVVEYDGGKQKQCNFKDERDVDTLLEVLAKEQPQLHLLSAAGEQALEICEALVRSGAVDVVVVDSVAAMVTKAEIEGEMGDTHVGLQARLMSQALRKLTGAIGKSNAIVIFINQLREKIGVMYGNPETTPGGRALKFYSSVRLDVRRTEQLKAGGEVIGNRVRVKVVKNKVAPPFKEAEFDIMYGQGVSRLGEILDLGSKLDIVQKSGAWFNYGDVRLGQGRDNAKEYLRQNPELAEEIAAKVMENADKLMGRTAAAAPKKLGQVNLTAEVDDE